MNNRTLPSPAVEAEALHSATAEQAVLDGIVVYGHDLLAKIDAVGFDADDFYDPINRKIYGVLRAYAKKHKTISYAEVVEHFFSRQLIAGCGGHQRISRLGDVQHRSSHTAHWAEMVQRYAAQRALRDSACRILHSINAGDDPAAISQEAQRALANAALASAGSDLVDGQAMADAIMHGLHTAEAATTYIPTGIDGLDAMLGGGLVAGRLYIVGGRAKNGKSAAALAVAVGACRAGHRVHIDSLEMTAVVDVTLPDGREIRKPGDITSRLRSMVSGVPFHSAQHSASSHHLSAAQVDQIRRAAYEIAEWRITTDDKGARTIAQIVSSARNIKARHPDLDVLIVDYIGLLKGSEATRREVMGECSGALKALAKELQIAVVALAQLNRKAEDRAGGRPMAHDLKESGDLEQDADAIVLVHNPHVAGHLEEDTAILLHLALYRHGQSGQERWCAWDGATQRIGQTIPDPTAVAVAIRQGRDWWEDGQ